MLASPVAQLVAQTAVPLTFQAEVVPDTEGAIAEVTIHYDPNLQEQLQPVYRDLFAELPPDVSVRALCPSNQAVDEFIKSWGTAAGSRAVQVVNVGVDISAWARDRYVARQIVGGTNRAPGYVAAAWDAQWDFQASEIIAYWLLSEADLEPAPLTTWLRLDGGNVVANHRHAFVTAAVFEDNWLAPHDFVLRELRRVLGRDCLIIKDQFGGSPWEHADMFITPLTDDTILVASEELAEDVLLDAWGEEEYLDFFTELFPDTCGAGIVESQLDYIADGLRNAGYRVLRVPAIFNEIEDWLLTYNNVLLDNRTDTRVAYMPIYHISPLDCVAEAVYTMEGFEVRTIDASKIYVHGGTVRCLANVTRRTYATGDSAFVTPPQLPGVRSIDLAARRVLGNGALGRPALPVGEVTRKPMGDSTCRTARKVG